MTVDAHDLELKLIRRAAGLELDLLSLQGLWTEAQYLRLTDQTNQFIELTDGYLEGLPLAYYRERRHNPLHTPPVCLRAEQSGVVY